MMAFLLLLALLLTPEECKRDFKSCVCYYVGGQWVCEGLTPRVGQG